MRVEIFQQYTLQGCVTNASFMRLQDIAEIFRLRTILYTPIQIPSRLVTNPMPDDWAMGEMGKSSPQIAKKNAIILVATHNNVHFEYKENFQVKIMSLFLQLIHWISVDQKTVSLWNFNSQIVHTSTFCSFDLLLLIIYCVTSWRIGRSKNRSRRHTCDASLYSEQDDTWHHVTSVKYSLLCYTMTWGILYDVFAVAAAAAGAKPACCCPMQMLKNICIAISFGSDLCLTDSHYILLHPGLYSMAGWTVSRSNFMAIAPLQRIVDRWLQSHRDR